MTKPRPEFCGHCGESADNQGHYFLCYSCGRMSHPDGTPIEGNGHFRANYSGTLPEANRHGIAEFRKD